MESQYEKLSAPRTHYNKAYIDFYKTNKQEFVHLEKQGLYSNGKNTQEDVELDLEIESIHLNSNMNTQAIPNEQTTNYQQRTLKDSRETHKKGGENRRLSQEKVTIRSDKDLIQQRQIELNARNLGGVKSALNNYGTTGSSNNQKSKQSMEERKDNPYQVSGGYAQTMTKSQSQNKIMFTSPESFSLKNQQISAMGKDSASDKITFLKEKSLQDKNRLSSSGQEVLFKQHQQYSSGNQKKQGAYQLKQSNHHVLSVCSTKECTFCKTQGVHSHSLGAAPCQSIYCKQHQSQILISNKLSEKYSNNRDYFNVKIINDLIYNENTHVVSIFKDYLILDDINEFLKRSYTYQETKLRLPKLCSFYDKYSQVFPNFVVLPESKYMFKNIQRKQKLIDEQYQIQEELARKQHQTLLDEDKLFNSKFYNSVYKMDLSMTRQQYEDQAKQICTQVGKKPNQGIYGKIEDMKIEDLVDRFLIKDSESNIQMVTMGGLDFSGFTNSTIQMERTPNKNSDKKPQSNVKNTAQTKKVNQPLAKRNQQPEMIQKKPVNQIAQAISTTTNQRKQKGSFNTNTNKVTTKIDVNKNPVDINGSTKTTPRLTKKSAPAITQDKGMTASPETKQALNAYLQNCQIEDQKMQVLDSTIKYGDLYESPNLKSPINQSQKQFQNLLSSGSQTTLGHQVNLTSSLAMNRQQMKSQANLALTTSLAHTQQINKKNARLSTGDQFHSKTQPARKGVSPIPQNLIASNNSQNNQSQVSRNFGGQQSTQKNNKQINSHAKYLSGGNDYYKQMLNNQQTYASQETIISGGGGSSNKKALQSKIGNFGQMDLIKEHMERHDDVSEHDIVTGDDCGDEHIADERLGSPDMFSTDDAGRKSLEGRQYNQQMNQFLLTSADDKMMLSQYTNYDQIKKHLEKYITTQQQESNHSQLSAANQKFKSEKKQKEQDQFNTRSHKQIIQSACGNYNENSSRNGAAQKHFESLKQKIRGVFDQGDIDTGNKTPNKSSTHSKKSCGMGQNNRMSIEAKDMMLNTQNIQPCLSSTSAAGRTLSFSQTGFSNNPNNNYRSITNLQQRKGSANLKEKSVNESKRLSQNRQSFKDVEQSQAKIIKRCATGKTLSINEAHHHTFGGTQQPGFLNSVASSGTLLNPTFISSTSTQGNKIYQTQQQQAANTVRVMTPSYSLASLSKLVTPTTSTSPMTMTVTLAGSNQSRKQEPLKKSNIHAFSQQHKPAQSGGTFLLSDKSNKLISNNKNQPNIVTNKSVSRVATKQVSIQGNTGHLAQKTKQVTLMQSNSQQNLQITPRSIIIHQDMLSGQPKHEIIQESSNLSCTVSTENNSAAKTIESKHPKFMRTIEEVGGVHAQSYNNILSSSLAVHKKSQFGLQTSQAHFDLRSKAKIQASAHSKKAGVQQLATSQSVSHFKSPSQQIQNKKAAQGKYQQF